MVVPGRVVSEARSGRISRVEWIAAGMTILASLGLLLGSTAWRPAVLGSALGEGDGPSIATDEPTRSIGEVAPEHTATVTFTLRNLTDHPIRIQGAQSSCSCSVVEGIPCEIAPGDVQEIRGVVGAGSKPGPFDGSFVLYTDDDREPEVRLRYTGRVVLRD